MLEELEVRFCSSRGFTDVLLILLTQGYLIKHQSTGQAAYKHKDGRFCVGVHHRKTKESFCFDTQ